MSENAVLQQCILELLRAKETNDPQELLAVANRLRPSLASALGQREDSFGLQDAQEYLLSICRDLGVEFPHDHADQATTTEGLLSPNTEEQLRLSLDMWSGSLAAAARDAKQAHVEAEGGVADSLEFALPLPQPTSAPAPPPPPAETESKKRLTASPIRRTDLRGVPVGAAGAGGDAVPAARPASPGPREIRVSAVAASSAALVPEILDVGSIPAGSAASQVQEGEREGDLAPSSLPEAIDLPLNDSLSGGIPMARAQAPPAPTQRSPTPSTHAAPAEPPTESILEATLRHNAMYGGGGGASALPYVPVPHEPRDKAGLPRLIYGQQGGAGRAVYVAPNPTTENAAEDDDGEEEDEGLPQWPQQNTQYNNLPQHVQPSLPPPAAPAFRVELPKAVEGAVQATLQRLHAGSAAYSQTAPPPPQAESTFPAPAPILLPGMRPEDLYPNLSQLAKEQPLDGASYPVIQVAPRPRITLDPTVTALVEDTITALKPGSTKHERPKLPWLDLPPEHPLAIQERLKELTGGELFDWDLAKAELGLLQRLGKELQTAAKEIFPGAKDRDAESVYRPVARPGAALEEDSFDLDDLEAFQRMVAREVDARLAIPTDVREKALKATRDAQVAVMAKEAAALRKAELQARREGVTVAAAPSTATKPVTAGAAGGAGAANSAAERARRQALKDAALRGAAPPGALDIRRRNMVGGSTRRGVDPLPDGEYADPNFRNDGTARDRPVIAFGRRVDKPLPLPPRYAIWNTQPVRSQLPRVAGLQNRMQKREVLKVGRPAAPPAGGGKGNLPLFYTKGVGAGGGKGAARDAGMGTDARRTLLRDMLRVLMGAAADQLVDGTAGTTRIGVGAGVGVGADLDVNNATFAGGPAFDSVRAFGEGDEADDSAVRTSRESQMSEDARGIAEGLSDWLTDGILARVLLEYRQRKDQVEGVQTAPTQTDVHRLRALATEALTDEITRAMQAAADEEAARRAMAGLRSSVDDLRASRDPTLSDSSTSRSLMDLILRAMEEGSVEEPQADDKAVNTSMVKPARLAGTYDNSLFNLDGLGTGAGGVDSQVPEWASTLERRAKEVADRIQGRLARVNDLIHGEEPSTDDSVDYAFHAGVGGRFGRKKKEGQDEGAGTEAGAAGTSAGTGAGAGAGMGPGGRRHKKGVTDSLDRASVEDYAAYLRDSLDRGLAALQAPLGFLGSTGGAARAPAAKDGGVEMDDLTEEGRRRTEALDEEAYLRRQGPGTDADWKPAGLPKVQLMTVGAKKKPYVAKWREVGRPEQSESDEDGSLGMRLGSKRVHGTKVTVTKHVVVTREKAAHAAMYEEGEDLGTSRDFTVSTRDSVQSSGPESDSVAGARAAAGQGPAPPARNVVRELGRFGVRRRIGRPRVLNSESFESDSVLDDTELRASNSHESSDDEPMTFKFAGDTDMRPPPRLPHGTLRGPGAGYFAGVRVEDAAEVMLAGENLSEQEDSEVAHPPQSRRLRTRKAREEVLSSSSLERGIEQLSAAMRKVQAMPNLPLPIRERPVPITIINTVNPNTTGAAVSRTTQQQEEGGPGPAAPTPPPQ